jgi:hypothetical protein
MTGQRPVPWSSRRGGAAARLLLATVAVLLLSLAGSWIGLRIHRALAGRHAEQATLTLLRSEELAFLVTDRLVSQIAVKTSDSSPILGQREGVLIATVRMYYGLDLRKLDAASITRAGKDRVVVRLPDPEMLDFAVDPSSFTYITKRSGLNVIRDYVMDKDIEAELRVKLRPHAVRFFADQRLLPTRARIVQRLQGYLAPLERETGMQIELR